MDKQALIDQIYAGVPERSLSYLPPSHWAYNKNLKDPGYDTARAAALLDEAGWAVGSDGIREKDGVRLAFTISTTAGNKSRERGQQLFQQNLKAIGADMTLNNMPASVVWGDYTVKSEFDTLMVAWDPLLFPDPDYSDRIMSDRIPAKGGNGANYVQFENAEVDELCRQGLSETVPEKRKAIYDRIQEILLDELPFAPIFVHATLVAKDAAVQGYGVNSYHSTNTWNCSTWKIG
jgi:peptide/nickel transport system substrate-binding protein